MSNIRYIINLHGLPILKDMLEDLGAEYNQYNVDKLHEFLKTSSNVTSRYVHSQYNQLGAYITNGRLIVRDNV